MASTQAVRRIARRFAHRTALILTLVAAAPLAASAAGGTAPGTPRIAERPGVSFMRIARDPETGGWTLAPMTAAELARNTEADLQLALNQSSAGLVAVPLSRGGYAMDLQGRFQSFSVARRDASGGLRYDCGEDPLSLFHWLTEVPEPVDVYGRPTR